MILTLLSMLGGGLMRLLPEVFSFMNKKQDNSHELAMLDRQFELEKTRSANHLTEIQFQGDVDTQVAFINAQKEALVSQMQKTGIGFIDGLNFLVRPLCTYYLLVMYGIMKLGMFMVALQAGTGKWDAVVSVYDVDDFNLLAGVIAFWFVGRVFDKKECAK